MKIQTIKHSGNYIYIKCFKPLKFIWSVVMGFILSEEKTGITSLNYINFYPTRVDNWILVLSLWKTFYLSIRKNLWN